MGLWATGEAGHSAGIAAIKAAINANIITQNDGSFSLNSSALSKWLSDQADLIINQDVVLENRNNARAVLPTINANYDVKKLADSIGKSNWNSRQEFPVISNVVSSQGFISATMAAIAAMDKLAADIGFSYADAAKNLPQTFADIYTELNIESTLPEIQTRFVDSRFYIYTYVNDLGEESAPSPVSSIVELDQDDHANITLTPPPSGRGIVGIRVYRSNVGSQTASFQQVTVVAPDPLAAYDADGNFKYFLSTTTTGVDSVKGSALQEACPSTTWAEPPARLQGLVNMPNGILAGFVDNYVAFCEPFKPYAWPVEYQITTKHPIIGLGVFGQTLVVCHTSGVDYISGADSFGMSSQQDVSKQSCISKMSIVSVDGGVVFASPDGLCCAYSAGVMLLTDEHFTREDWQAIGPSGIQCAYHEGTVYFWGVSNNITYAFHLPTKKLTTLNGVTGTTAVYRDSITDELYRATGTTVYEMFTGTGYRTGKWRGKIAVMPMQTSLAWLTIESDFSTPVTVRWFGDGVLVDTSVVTNLSPVRLPPGRWLEHEVEVESSARWNCLTMASSSAELRIV